MMSSKILLYQLFKPYPAMLYLSSKEMSPGFILDLLPSVKLFLQVAFQINGKGVFQAESKPHPKSTI